jgi:hypothetical protein
VLSTAPITAPSFDETAGICTIVAVVDTHRVLRVRVNQVTAELTLEFSVVAGTVDGLNTL